MAIPRGRDIIDIGDLGDYARRLDGKKYGTYKKLYGIGINYHGILAYFTRIQSDPYAPPSYMEIVVPSKEHRLRVASLERHGLTAVEDYIYRLIYKSSRRLRIKCGSGHSCFIGVPRPRSIIIRRSSVEILENRSLLLRLLVGLPALGRRIKGRYFDLLFNNIIKRLIDGLRGLDRYWNEISRLIKYIGEYVFIRDRVVRERLVSFIADGSILPRESSISDQPLKEAVPFKVQPAKRSEILFQNGGKIHGLLIGRGLTIITGGGFHGKTTLLESIQEGIYPHIPGDGREYVVSHPKTFYVRAEDGRFVHHVDIRSFIKELPDKKDTGDFVSLDASGSTSMAASINELVEAGAMVLLIDEDTSATNLLFKDEHMEKLLSYDPVKTISQQIGDFTAKTGINVVVVSSSSSSLLSRSDIIVLMRNYNPRIYKPEELGLSRRSDALPYIPPRKRFFHGIKGIRKLRCNGYRLVAKYTDGTSFDLDLSINKRIVERGQARMIGEMIMWINRSGIKGFIDELAEKINRVFENKGFAGFSRPVPPDLGWVDGLDVIWALNRLKGVRISQRPS